MTNSITPPRELTEQWASEKCYDERDWLYELHIAARAAQWGADQELEACCKELEYNFMPDSSSLRAARRPKPPSLKEEAMQALCRFMAGEGHDDCTEEEIEDDFKTIRRALEALSDD